MYRNSLKNFQEEKKDLINFMICCGFDWIVDIDYKMGEEFIASKCIDSEDLWWRPLEVEGSGFTRLFKYSIRDLWSRYKTKKNGK